MSKCKVFKNGFVLLKKILRVKKKVLSKASKEGHNNNNPG